MSTKFLPFLTGDLREVLGDPRGSWESPRERSGAPWDARRPRIQSPGGSLGTSRRVFLMFLRFFILFFEEWISLTSYFCYFYGLFVIKVDL